jgi:DNA-directed RNA polymerase specialized sigma24 family protein
LLDQLDEPLQQIAIMKMEGYTDGEIAEKLGVVTRTVERKMARIRAKWEAEERKNET